jgi:phage tail protein X
MSLAHRAPPVRRFLDVLSSHDGRTHQVAERVLTADPGSAGGRPVARCGRLLVVASLAAPPGPPCALCTAAP